MTPEIAVDVAEYICQYLQDNSCCKKILIDWFGGEPLLCVEVMEIISRKLMSYANDNNIQYSASITTNGRLLDSEMLTRIQKIGIKRAQITVDGMRDIYCESKSAKPQDFDSVIDNICNAADKTILSIRLNIPQNNAGNAIAITDYLFKECNLSGMVRIYFAFVRNYSSSPHEMSRAYTDYVDNYFRWLDHVIEHYGMDMPIKEHIPKRLHQSCGILRNCNICVGPSGELYKCNLLLGDGSHITGDVWHGRYYNDAENVFLTTIEAHSNECYRCVYLPICMGGCLAHRMLGYGGQFDCDASMRLKLRLKLLKGGVDIKTIIDDYDGIRCANQDTN
jgi:uncharacterized protein